MDYIFPMCVAVRSFSPALQLPLRKLPYLKKGSDQVRSRLPGQKIYVTALIRFVYGPNKRPILITKAA